MSTNQFERLQKETARKCLHSLGIKYRIINGKTGFADGHERPDVKTQRRHLVNVMSELGKESFLYLSPMTVERAAMWGIPRKVIEERIMEVIEKERGQRFSLMWMTFHNVVQWKF